MEQERSLLNSPKSPGKTEPMSMTSLKNGGYFKLGSPIKTKDLVVKGNGSPKKWCVDSNSTSKIFNSKQINSSDIEKLSNTKAGLSPEKLPFSTQINGVHKNSATVNAVPKWNGPSPKQSPIKNNEQSSDQGLFHLSKLKAQPALYRRMFGVFKEDRDVLARWSDGLYYLGTVCKVSDFEHRCFVQFEDKSICWVHFKDLQPINNRNASDDENSSDDELDSDMTCALCRDGNSEPPNEIVLCDKCGQGYHQLCHIPSIDTKVLKEEDMPWQCRTCVFAAAARRGGADADGPGAVSLKHMKQVLPYDITSLSWDKGRKTNQEEIYCYCGGPGDWYLKMLQCCRCQQWFHEACIQCLETPILYGDRFFLFVCSICNHGNEYVKRLPMRWVDVVHLVLYNITIAKTVKYYDFYGAIVPFFAQNWEALQLGDLVHEASTRSQLKDRILETLQNNKSRFQCGCETKKAKMSWGLRTRSPPVPPTVSVPGTEVINDDLLQSLDLRHGSLLLSESPTPFKRSGPGDTDTETPLRKRIHRDSTDKDWGASNNLIKSGIIADGNLPSAVNDNIFDRLSYNFNGNANKSMEGVSSSLSDQPKRRRGRGRPRKESFAASKPPIISRGRGRPSGSAGRLKRKDQNKIKKGPSSFTSESSTVIPMSELFHDIPGTKTSDSTGHDAYDKDLRRAMAKYFGAEGRIACGERFNVVAKRVLTGLGSDDGGTSRVEYLIEWEGYTAKQLHESLQRR